MFSQYLTLDHRINNQRNIESEFGSVDLEKFIPNDNPRHSHLGRVHASHIKMLEKCKDEAPGKHCLIMEDDAMWVPWREHSDLGTEIKTVDDEANPWDIMLLGINAYGGKQTRAKDLLKPFDTRENSTSFGRTWWGCEAYVVNKDSKDSVIEFMKTRGHRNTLYPCVEKIPENSGLSIVGPKQSIIMQNHKKDFEYNWTL